MNSPIQDLISNHRSIRKYRPDPVPEEILERILTTGMRASSSGNMQPYSIIVTTDLNVKRELLPFHFDQSMVMDAPVLLTFCSDFHRMRLWLQANDAPLNFDNLMSFLIGMIDATLVSQNVALTAEAEGLGICYMGTTLASCLEISKILKLPEHVVPVVGFSLGYPDEMPEVRSRLPLTGVIHRDRYQDYTGQQINQIYQAKEAEGMARYKALIKNNEVKNLAQVYTKIKYTEESHLKYTQNVLSCLIKQGFLRAHA